MTLFWVMVGLLLLVVVLGYLVFRLNAQPQQKPGLGKEISREHLTVMARDPQWLFAYWDLPSEALNTGNGQPVLRVYHLTNTGQFDPQHTAHFDIELEQGTDNWHIKNLQPGETYVLEIGLRQADGSIQSLARSRRVTTPNAGKGYHDPDPHWQPIDELYKQQSGNTPAGSSELMQGRND